MSPLAALEIELKAVLDAATSKPDSGRFTALSFAERCRGVPGAERMEIAALLRAAWGHRVVGDFRRAEQLLSQIARKALACQATEVVSFTRIARAELASEQGRHSLALGALVSLAQDDRCFAQLSDHDRSRVYARLADLTLDVDPGDGVDLALRLGDEYWRRRPGTPPWKHLLVRGCLQLNRHLWCHERLSGLLHTQNLDRTRAPEYLRAATDAFRGISMVPVPGESPVSMEFVSIMRDLTGALAATDLSDLRNAALRLMANERRMPWTGSAANLYLAAASLVAHGDYRAAAPMVAHAKALQSQEPARMVWWLHLEAEIAAQSGDAVGALALYKSYVKAASTARELQRLDVRTLIATLSPAASAGSDAPMERRPAYLERALNYIATNCATATVELAAEHAGVSARTLRNAFSVYLGRQPKEYIMDHRLDAARAAILSPGSIEISIAEIAQRHGFSHLGRFSKLYQSKYREKPSDTRTGAVSTSPGSRVRHSP